MKRAAAAGLIVLALAATAFAAEQAPPVLPGKIEAVTVYRGQALVTRMVEVPGAAGLKEIVVSDLPARVQEQSLYAEAVEGVEVRSVLYRERPVPDDVRADVKKMDDEIRAIGDKLLANRQSVAVVQQQRDYLTKLESFTAPTANVELTKGVLNAETLKTLTGFIFDQRRSLSDQDLKLAIEGRTLSEQLTLLQRQREQVAEKSAKTIREAVIFVNQKAAGAKFHLRYMVDSASWDPSYIVRADKGGKVTLEYNASIQQQSGEDWPNVQMTLSTATPSLVAEAPTLNPLRIALVAPTPNAPGGGGGFGGKDQSYADLKQQYQQKLRDAEQARNSGNFDLGGSFNNSLNGANNNNNSNNNNNTGGQQQAGGQPGRANQFDSNNRKAADDSLNDVAGEQQVAELLARKSAEERSVRASREVISVTYELPSKTSLPSRSDQQLIQVASLPMKGAFYKVAQPLLTSYVYDQAEMSNDSKMVLLAGPVSSYMEGQFVGHTDVPTVAIGETFTVGFGIDSSLRASRERIDKTEVTQGGNRELTYTYQLQLENFGDKPMMVRLMDRLPITQDNVRDSDVRVTLVTGEAELSKDADYQRSQRKKGMLRWDVEVPAQAIGDKAFGKEYKFKVEYDRQMTIMGIPAAAK